MQQPLHSEKCAVFCPYCGRNCFTIAGYLCNVSTIGSCNIYPRSLSAQNASGADHTLAREHGLDIEGQSIPLHIYTFDVDYRDINVQVGKELTTIDFGMQETIRFECW